MHVELVLGALEPGRVHDEGDLLLVGDAALSGLPGKRPDAGGAPGVLDAGDPDAGQGEPMDESGRTPAHLDVADGHVVGGLRPHVDGGLAAARITAGALDRRGAGRAVAGHGCVEALGDDAPQDVARSAGVRRAAREDRRRNEGEEPAPSPAPKIGDRDEGSPRRSALGSHGGPGAGLAGDGERRRMLSASCEELEDGPRDAGGIEAVLGVEALQVARLAERRHADPLAAASGSTSPRSSATAPPRPP